MRETTFGKHVSERAAHQLSGVTAVAAFGLYFAAGGALAAGAPIGRRRGGDRLLVLTVGFEFGFGRTVAKRSWNELVRDYDLAAGHTWPLVLAWIAAGPAIVSARHRRP